MRTRQEIEKQSKRDTRIGNAGQVADTNSILILEVCLDIRDLILHQEISVNLAELMGGKNAKKKTA